ncbi:helix-turn-helix transcriptional regulator [Micromonospora sp. PLK6-60]|uniref:helix-turn-helix transcriptional regulator n=1 Tax=Micromonospora sp. PLK6-60 TaxID=2873383 RepID=UPI00210472CC|nr:helix-turn-helix transcriptional regulator [Micromonospora sp. PLK6-60]
MQRPAHPSGWAGQTPDDVDTRDPELAHHLIARRFGEHRPRISGPRSRFRFRRRTRRVENLELDHIRYPLGVRTDTPPYPHFTAVTVTQGCYGVTSRGEELRLRHGDCGRYPNAPGRLVSEDVTAFVVRLPLAPISAVATTRTGLPAEEFHFTALAPVSPALAAHWQSVGAFLRRQVEDNAEAVANPLVRAGLLDLVAATALAVFPNTSMTAQYLPGPGRVLPPVVRRAAAYIEAHAVHPLTVAQIAAACQIGPRALQAAFQRHHGQSPMAFLRAIRLRRAHQDLRDAQPGQTVAATALRWGWAHPGRFARAYRDTYGRSPGDTLRGSGGWAPTADGQ